MNTDPELKYVVDVMIEGRARYYASVEMTREQYEEWCERVDDAHGFEAEQVAEELLDKTGVDVMRDIDVSSLRVEDFNSETLEAQRKAERIGGAA